MKIQRLILPAIALFLGTTLQITATARSLNESEQEVEAQLQAVIEAQTQEGYQLAFPRTLARLSRGAQAPKTVLLYPNRQYSFVAVCDQSCMDVDLIVKDPKGNVVASDVSEYAIAVVPFVPSSEDRYEVSVKMSKCSTSNCNFGLGIFFHSDENTPSSAEQQEDERRRS